MFSLFRYLTMVLALINPVHVVPTNVYYVTTNSINNSNGNTLNHYLIGSPKKFFTSDSQLISFLVTTNLM